LFYDHSNYLKIMWELQIDVSIIYSFLLKILFLYKEGKVKYFTYKGDFYNIGVFWGKTNKVFEKSDFQPNQASFW